MDPKEEECPSQEIHVFSVYWISLWPLFLGEHGRQCKILVAQRGTRDISAIWAAYIPQRTNEVVVMGVSIEGR